MDVLTQVVVWLNVVANALGTWLLAPIAALPGWLSVTLVSAVTGLLMLVAFKYTSHQQAIKAVRSDIKAQLLALRLFKDNPWVMLRAQGRVFMGAVRLMVLAVVPMLVMLVPISLLLGQLALWYQARPLRVGEEAVITVQLSGPADSAWPKVSLEPTDAAEVVIGPVHVFSQRQVCWEIRARTNGYHRLRFHVEGPTHGTAPFVADKELAIGLGLMRVSAARPSWDWTEVLLNPAETPFEPDAPVQSITIDYPPRVGWASGTNRWLIFWFIASMVAALIWRRWVPVNL